MQYGRGWWAMPARFVSGLIRTSFHNLDNGCQAALDNAAATMAGGSFPSP